MSGEYEAIILYTVFTLDKGEDKVAHLRNKCDYKAQQSECVNGGELAVEISLCKISVEGAEADTEQCSANAALDSFLGAYVRDKLMASEEKSCKVSEGISYPRTKECEKENVFTDFHIAEKHQAHKACNNECAGSKRYAHLFKGDSSAGEYRRSEHKHQDTEKDSHKNCYENRMGINSAGKDS